MLIFPSSKSPTTPTITISDVDNDIPKTMITWQKHRGVAHPVRVEVPVPPLSPNGLLVKILAAGICHSDCAMMRLDDIFPPHWQEKFTMGHEGAGEIVEIGENVEPGRFKLGDKVAILNSAGCNEPTCVDCCRGLQRVCPNGQTCGMGTDGSFAPYVSLRKTWEAVKLPDGVSPAQGAVAVDAVMTAYHAIVVKADVKKWDTVLVYGVGGLGMNAIQILNWVGVQRIIMVDRRQKALDEAAMIFGIKLEDAIWTGNNPEAAEDYILKNNILVDKVFDFAGVEQTFNSAQVVVRPGGTITLVGLMNTTVPLQSLALIFKDITVHCCYSGSRESLVRCLDLIADGVMNPLLQMGDFEALPEILEDLDAGKFTKRIVVVPK